MKLIKLFGSSESEFLCRLREYYIHLDFYQTNIIRALINGKRYLEGEVHVLLSFTGSSNCLLHVGNPEHGLNILQVILKLREG